MEQVLKSIIKNAKDFPALPSTTLKVLQLLTNEVPDYKTLAKLISTDVSIATGVLKTANSPFYGQKNEVVNIEQAISVLGINKLKNITLSLSVINIFPREHLNYYSELFNTSLATSIAAEMIGKCFPFKSKPEIFLAGLLSKIGMFVLLRYLTDQYMSVIENAKKRGLKLDIVEEALIGSTHIDIGLLVAKKWNLPEPVIQTIRYHNTIVEAENTVTDEDNLNLIKTIYLSWLSINIFTGWDKAYSTHFFKKEFVRLTKKDEKVAFKFLNELPNAVSKYAESYNVRGCYIPSFDKIKSMYVDELIENRFKFEKTYNELNYVLSVLRKKNKSLTEVNSELNDSKSQMEAIIAKLFDKYGESEASEIIE